MTVMAKFNREYLQLSQGRLFATDEFSAPVNWDRGVKLTMVDLLRDLYVMQRKLSWVSLPESQRRLIYTDIVTRIMQNGCYGARDDIAQRLGADRKKKLDDLLEETVERLILRDETADLITPLME
jgi:hypothetical protein